MKVIFSDSFKSEIERIDGTVVITKAVLENDKTKYIAAGLRTALLSGFREDACIDLVSGIWNDKTKQFHIRLDFPDTYIINKKVSVDGEFEVEDIKSYNVIKFLWRNNEIAFVLFNDFTETEGYLSEIDFSQIKNLFTVQLPSTTKAKNIGTLSLDSNTSFLEGGGIQAGTSLLRLWNENNKTESTINLESYYHFCSIYSTEQSNELDLPYVDKYGKRIDNYYKYRRITDVFISCYGASEIYNNMALYGIPESGVIDIKGVVQYDEYTIIGDSIISTDYNQTAPLNSIPGLRLECLENSGFEKFEIDNDKKCIVYKCKPENEREVMFAKADLVISYYDYDVYYKSRNTDPLYSNTLTISQSNLEWAANISTSFINISETGEKTPVYIFNYNDSDYKSLTINTSIDFDKNLTVDEISNLFIVTVENDAIYNYFQFESTVNKSDDFYTFNCKFKPRNSNTGTNWYPLINGESSLIKITISYKEKSESFYVIQKRMLKLPWIDKATSDANVRISLSASETEFHILSEDYPTRPYWGIFKIDSGLQISKKSGKLLTSSMSTSFPVGQNRTDESGIYTLDTNNSLINKYYSFTIYEFPESCKDVDFETNTNWIYEIETSSSKINCVLEGTPAVFKYTMSTQDGENKLQEPGILKLSATSNFPYSIKFSQNPTSNGYNSSTYVNDPEIYIYNTGTGGIYESSKGEVFYSSEDSISKDIYVIYRKPGNSQKTLNLLVDCTDTSVDNFNRKTISIPVNQKDEELIFFHSVKGRRAITARGNSKNYCDTNYSYLFVDAEDDSKKNSIPFGWSKKINLSKSTNNIELGTDLALKNVIPSKDNIAPEYKYELVTTDSGEQRRPNQELWVKLNRDYLDSNDYASYTNLSAKEKLFPTSTKMDTVLVEKGNGTSHKVYIIRKGLAPEFHLFDSKLVEVTDDAKLSVSPVENGSTFILYSRYKLAGKLSKDMTRADADTSHFAIYNNCDVNYTITYNGIEEGLGPRSTREQIIKSNYKGWHRYTIKIEKSESNTINRSSSVSKLFKIMSFIPVYGYTYLDGTVSEGINELLNQEAVIESGDIDKNTDYYNQEEADEIAGTYLRSYEIAFKDDIIYPSDHDNTLGETEVYMTGKTGVIYSAYTSRIAASLEDITEEADIPENAYVLYNSSSNPPAFNVSFTRTQNCTVNSYTLAAFARSFKGISYGFTQRNPVIKKISLTDSTSINRLFALGQPRDLSFNVSVSSRITDSDYFSIKNIQKGVESALVYLNGAQLDAIPGRYYGSDYYGTSKKVNSRRELYPTLMEKVIGYSNNTNYIDIVLGTINLGENSLDNILIDASGLSVTLDYEATNTDLSFDLINGGKTYYKGESTKPNVRLYIDSKVLNNASESIFTIEVKSTSEEDNYEGNLVIAGGKIKLTKYAYKYSMNTPSDLYFNSDGTLISGPNYIDGNGFIFTTDCKALKEKEKLQQYLIDSDSITPTNVFDDYGIYNYLEEGDIEGEFRFIISFDSRHDISSLASGELSFIIDGYEVSTIRLHQGLFSPVYYVNGTPIPVQIKNETGRNLGDFSGNKILVTTSPQSIGILDIDYNYNNGYKSSTAEYTSYTDFNNLCRIVGTPVWKINGGELNVDDYLKPARDLVIANRGGKASLEFYCEVMNTYVNSEFDITIDYWMEVKERLSSSWTYVGNSSIDIDTLESDENVVHGRLTLKHKP